MALSIYIFPLSEPGKFLWTSFLGIASKGKNELRKITVQYRSDQISLYGKGETTFVFEIGFGRFCCQYQIT
jgi:hypothetical protein